MSWPKHNYGWIVIDGQTEQPIRMENCAEFGSASGFAEIFLDKRVAFFVRDIHRKMLRNLGFRDAGGHRNDWFKYAGRTRTIRVALPGTYPQVTLESLRELARSVE